MGNTDQKKALRIDGVRLDFQADPSRLPEAVATRLGVASSALDDIEVVRTSLDARGRPALVFNVDASVDSQALPSKLPGGVRARPDTPDRPPVFDIDSDERVIVIGAGPAGLFCADRLASSGVQTILLERGQPVEVRGRDVSGLMHRGELKRDSNICFGEGGAGTWSDGKLHTRVSDERGRQVLERIVELGGPEEILTRGKPHLGTDRLVALCKAFRKRLLDADCEIRFGAFVDKILVETRAGQRRVAGVELRDGERIDGDRIILAVGHSAREMYRHLADLGVAMEPKPFAVGFRVEHRQALIDDIQYGKYAGKKGLPAADYRLASNFEMGGKKRGVYSFCMCPGGQVVPSHTLPQGICVNGMSHASRQGHFANSALVVTVDPSDFSRAVDDDHPETAGGLLSGMVFQHQAEQHAYELGGGGFVAPAQRLTEFKSGLPATSVRETTYKPGIAAADLESCYPDFVIDALRRALGEFEKRMAGFVTDDALLIGVETRTSAPVRILRDPKTMESKSVRGLYPCGEGAGYGGGIVSAAIDGLRICDKILLQLSQ